MPYSLGKISLLQVPANDAHPKSLLPGSATIAVCTFSIFAAVFTAFNRATWHERLPASAPHTVSQLCPLLPPYHCIDVSSATHVTEEVEAPSLFQNPTLQTHAVITIDPAGLFEFAPHGVQGAVPASPQKPALQRHAVAAIELAGLIEFAPHDVHGAIPLELQNPALQTHAVLTVDPTGLIEFAPHCVHGALPLALQNPAMHAQAVAVVEPARLLEPRAHCVQGDVTPLAFFHHPSGQLPAVSTAGMQRKLIASHA